MRDCDNIMFAMTNFFYLVPALLIVLTFHEFAHAWVANYLGDPTAKYSGRVSLNPIRHLDLMGTLLLFIVGLGWGKPVPVNPSNFKNPMRDSALTAAAGPAMNLVLAFAAALPYKYIYVYASDGFLWVADFFGAIFQLSIVLFIFNLFPFPPLDGSKVLGLVVPQKYVRQYAEFLHNGTMYFMIFVVVDMFFIKAVLGFSIMWVVISYLFAVVSTGILMIT